MASNTASGLIEAPHTQVPGVRRPDTRIPGVQGAGPRHLSKQGPDLQDPAVPVPGRYLLDRKVSTAEVPATVSSAGASSTEVSGAGGSGAETAGVPMPGPMPGLAHAPTAAAQVAEKPTIPAHMLPHRTPTQLLTIARQGLDEAAHTRPEGLRYATAHLAALRAAAAVLAARARPAAHTRRSRVTSAWSLLVLVAPEFTEWAGYFALGAGKRAAAEAGIPRVVTAREADDLLRAAEQFVVVVESALGLTYQPILAA
jgi:hypothetical protein